MSKKVPIARAGWRSMYCSLCHTNGCEHTGQPQDHLNYGALVVVNPKEGLDLPYWATSPTNLRCLVRPYSLYHKKRFRKPSHYEVVYPEDMVYSEYAPHPYSGRTHPFAGRVRITLPVKKAGSLEVETRVLYQNPQGEWLQGEILDHVDYKILQKQQKKEQEKKKRMVRRKLKYKTLWDIICGE